MEIILDIYGVIGALVIGLVLGLTGGGGSMLTIPILVYLLRVDPLTATSYSLFVVGVTALFGTFRNAKKGIIPYQIAIVFAIPAFITVYVTRKLIMPAIPETIFTVNEFILTKDLSIMILFAVIMFFASISMIKERKEKMSKEVESNYLFIIIVT